MEQIPAEQKVVQIHSVDEGAKYGTSTIPEVHDNEVLVKVDATGIGHFEHLLMTGSVFTMEFPYIPGSGAVGHVVKAGKGGEHLIGKRVVVGGKTGFWAEYAIVNIYVAFEIDEDVPLGSAAYGIGNPFTAIGIIETVKSKGKKSIVLDAAASALGRMIAKLAKRENIPILCVVKRKDQEEVLKSDGAKNVFVTQGDWQEGYNKITQEMDSDVLVDSLGTGETFDILVRGLIPGGLILIMGGLEGSSNIIPLGSTEEVEADKYTFKGFNMFSWFQSVPPEQKQKLFGSLSSQLKNQLSTTIAKTISLSNIKEAIEQSKQNQTKGKILLIP